MDTKTKEKRSLELSVTGSDEQHDFLCSPCSKEQKDVSASRYCKDCGNYLCPTCLNQHNRFEAMTLHEVVDINSEDTTQPAGEDRSTLPTLKCSVHHGKLLEMYCKEHNDVCCIICMTVKHSSCKSMTYLPTAAKDIDASTNVVSVQSRLKGQKSKLILLKQEKKTIRDKLISQIELGKKIINDEKQMVKEHVEKLETQLMEEINETTGKMVKKAEENSKEIDQAIQTLEKSEKLLTVGGNNQSDLFIKVIQVQQQLKDAKVLYQRARMEKPNVDQLYFKPNTNLSKHLKSIDSLGKMDYGRYPGACLIALYRNINVTCENEDLFCDISGACILSNGHILLADCKNRSLKMLNEAYEISRILQVSAIPWGVCTVNSTTIAVSMWNAQKVELVWVQGEMKVCSSFSVSDRCSGIHHKDEKLYVCVGGMRNEDGVVEVYTLAGIKLNTISCSLKRPRSVVVLDKSVFVADEKNGLVEIESECNATIHRSQDLMKAQSLCVDPNGTIFICGMGSNNVLTFSIEDKVFKSVLSGQDDFIKPQLLCFHQEKSRILVGVENVNFLKVYSLDKNNE